MVGNDVVDLLDPETRPGSCHARFDERVFAPPERAELRASAMPGRLRWLLWAAKEAAYKVAKKGDASTVFSPRAFVVRRRRDGGRVVEHDDGRRFALHVDLTRSYVHVVAAAASAPGATLLSSVERLCAGLARCPGEGARVLARGAVGERLGTPPDDLAVVREGKIPRLVRSDGALLGDLSLSHHGRFVAFACELPPDALGARSVA